MAGLRSLLGSIQLVLLALSPVLLIDGGESMSYQGLPIWLWVVFGIIPVAMYVMGRRIGMSDSLHDTPLELKIRRVNKDIVGLRMRGPILNDDEKTIKLWVSVVDHCSDEVRPILCHLDEFQEPNTGAYFVESEESVVPSSSGFNQFVEIARLIPGWMVPPTNAATEAMLICRVIDASNPPPIFNGKVEPDHPGVLNEANLVIPLKTQCAPYLEAVPDSEGVEQLAVRLLLFVGYRYNDKEVVKLISDWLDQRYARVDAIRPNVTRGEVNTIIRIADATYKTGFPMPANVPTRLTQLASNETRMGLIELVAKMILRSDRDKLENILDTQDFARMLNIQANIGWPASDNPGRDELASLRELKEAWLLKQNFDDPSVDQRRVGRALAIIEDGIKSQIEQGD